MNAWIVILGVAAGTYALRVSMFVLLGNRSLPTWTTTPMSLVGPAAIAGLVASMTFTHRGALHAAPLAELVALGAGFVAVRRSGNVMAAFLAGIPVFWLINLIA
jgi:branched-subunit amino acid transport protein